MNAQEWRAAGAALAPLDDIAVLLVAGDDLVTLAASARGVAAAAGDSRRVAVFDLAGAFGVGDANGLIRALHEGRSLNTLARPLDDGGLERFVVPRGPGVPDAALASHARWAKLVEGFRATGALLVITAPRSYGGLRALAGIADRAFVLGPDAITPFQLPQRAAPEPAQLFIRAPAPTPEAPIFIAPPRESPPQPHARPLPRRALSAAAVVAIVTITLASWYAWKSRTAPPAGVVHAADSIARYESPAVGRPDTIALPTIVNPGDSTRAAAWAVELVATNDRTDATFRLAENADWPAGTLSPVMLGDDSAPWYKIVVGAFVDRMGAEYFRATLRQQGSLERNAGVVSRVPLALRLDRGLAPATAKARVKTYAARGVAAYTLLGDDERATVYTGAFTSPEQSVVLIAQLRAAGMAPALAFRVGRTY